MRGARRKPTAVASTRARVDLRDAHERAQPRLARRRERLQPLADEAAVLALERDDVGDRGQRDEVEVLLRAPPRAPPSSLYATPGRAQVGARVAAQRRMDDRRVGQRAVGARRVVVGDDDVEAERARLRDLLHGGDRAVGGDEELRPALGEPLDRRGVQAVPVLGPAREEPVDVRAETAQRADEDRRRAHPVDVVVAVHGDPRARPRRAPRTTSTAVVDPFEGGRGMALVGREPRAAPPPDRRGRAARAPARRRGETPASRSSRRTSAIGAGATSIRAIGRGGGRVAELRGARSARRRGRRAGSRRGSVLRRSRAGCCGRDRTEGAGG